MRNVLSRILADKLLEVARAKTERSLTSLEQAMTIAPAVRSFSSALEARVRCGRPAIIAEMKRASPSRGPLRPNLDPVTVGRSYERAGAAALSVLTDGPYFSGAPADLIAARGGCSLPVLRKDFMVDAYQIAESRAMGADCVLLIVAALSDAQLAEFTVAAAHYGLDTLVEVHDRAELERALALPSGLIGINNRDLRTFVTSIDTTLGLLEAIPSGRLVITESGVLGREHVTELKAAGVPGFLIGEAFMVAEDPGEKLAQLFEGWL